MSDQGQSGCGCLIVLAVVAFGFYQCSGSGGENGGGGSLGSDDTSYESYDDARNNAANDLSGTSYQDYMGSSDCTEDCGGHDAGWQWADENGVTDAADCGGSGSFYAGCEAFTEQLDAETENRVSYDE